MKNQILKISAFVILLVLTGLNYAMAQVNAPSVKSGVTFQWAAAQPNNSSPALLQSITIDGNVFDQFVIPSGYEMTQVGQDGHNNNRIQQNGVQVFSNSSNAGWNAAALAAFQDVNLNHYFESNVNGRNICNDFSAVSTTTAQKQSLLYSSGIPSNSGGFVAITERNANNCYHIAVYGEPVGGGPVQLLGQTFVIEGPTVFGSTFAPPSGASDYWLSGRVNENNGTIGIALFRLSDLAPVGSTITRVQLTGATNDHGDGKFFIMQSYAVNEAEVTPIDTVLNADAGENDNVPPGSTYTIVAGPSNGTLNLNSNGTYTYTPNIGFTGSDSFVYQVCLPAPNDAVCDQATVNILVVTEPVAVDDSGSGLPGNPVTVAVLANDIPGTGVLVPSTVKIDGTANAGDALTVPGEGQWTINPANGNITFTPQVGFNGNPTPIQYSVTDQYGLTTNLATVTVTYLVGPTANNDASSTPMNQPVTLNALANDVIGDAALVPATLTFVPATLPNPATVGTFTTDGNGNVTFTPVALYVGPASVDYQICDANGLCDTATISITVTPVNPPIASNDSVSTLMNTSVNIDVLANDTVGDAPLAPATLSLNAATAPNPATVGTFTINPDNTVKFTPVSQFQGVATIEYEICDTNGLCDTALITVAVASDGPVAENDSASTPMNVPVQIEVLLNDLPGDAPLDPTSVTFVAGTEPNSATQGTFTVNNAGVVTFTPVALFTGQVTIDYQVCQEVTAVTSGGVRGVANGSIQSGLCDTATITVDVTPVAGPTANNDSASSLMNTSVNINVLANDTEGATPLAPATLSLNAATAPNPVTVGTFTINPDNTVKFTPVSQFQGVATIEYEICDTNGLCDTALITVAVASDGPVAVNDSATTFLNTPVDIDILDNDLEGDAPLDPTSVTFVPGTLPNAATEGTFTVNNAGIVTFTPVNGFLGIATVDYQVCQVVTAVTGGSGRGHRGGGSVQSGLCATATISVEVLPLPNPTANDDFASTEANEPVTINVLANDDPGGSPLDPSTVAIVPGTEPNPATEGSITVNPVTGAVTFTPVNGFIGVVVTTYEVCNTASFCDTALITINVLVPGGPISNFFPAFGFGTLAFEDLWPGKGDYDFNDLVIDYQFEITSNVNNFIDQVTGTFVIKAFGAAYQNGFGFQLPSVINAADLTVSGSSITENYISLSPNGTEAGQNAPTIIVFDNAYNEMPHPGGGAVGVNTENSATYITPKTITITIDFPAGIYTWNQLNIANFNPFLIVNMERGREVHLPGYAPTALANQAFFGTIDDASDLSQGRTYVTSNNLPWAIHIYERFDYPIEKQDIIWVHLKFVEWAESGGQTFQNWYQNLPGYRNQALIYIQP